MVSQAQIIKTIFLIMLWGLLALGVTGNALAEDCNTKEQWPHHLLGRGVRKTHHA